MSSLVSVPRVSIVLPVWNGAAFLAQALDSVLAQTFADFELICVDDGSRDSTPEILVRAAKNDARVRLVTNRTNRGLPASLNIGFAIARAPLHTWVSHDNCLRPQMLERLEGKLSADPQCAIAYAGYADVDVGGNRVGRHRVRPPEDLALANVVGPAFLYRSCVWQALGGYDEALRGVEDYDFWLRARGRFRFCPLDEELLDYRLHSGSLSAREASAIAAAHDRLLEREISRESDAGMRARAWLALMEQAPDISRLRYLARAVGAHPSTALRNARAALRWVRAALRS